MPTKESFRDYTLHARQRMQQRCISTFEADLVRTYGEKAWARHGAMKWYMTKKGRFRIQREMGKEVYKRVSDRLNICVVAKGNLVITVEKRYRKVRR